MCQKLKIFFEYEKVSCIFVEHFKKNKTMVIQRWQSVYLLIAAIALTILTFSNALTMTDITGCHQINLTALLQEGAVMTGMLNFYILTALSAILSLVNIFKFKNLKQQRRICWITILLLAIAIVTAVVNQILLPEGATVNWALPVYLIPFAMCCIYLASVRIKKDEDLLKSADRIR